MKNSTRLSAFALGIISTVLLACNPSNANKEGTANFTDTTADKKPQQAIPYKLQSGEKISLPNELLEISGIAFLEGQDEEIYAIQDEQGLLFKYHLPTQKLTFSQFGKDGDYEDIGISKTHFFVLKSNGSVYSFPRTDKDNIQAVAEQKDILPKGEYEGLYVDKAANLAYVLCKECRVDKKQSQTTGYIFSIGTDGKFSPKGEFSIQVDELKKLNPEIKKTFKPSALAKKTDSNEWYILSSIDKALVVTDENFKVKSLTPLDPKLFPQPEGINFDSKSNLYISSEAGDQDKGIIYKFEK